MQSNIDLKDDEQACGLNLSIDNLPLAIAILSVDDNTIVECNKSFCDFFQLGKELLIENSFVAISSVYQDNGAKSAEMIDFYKSLALSDNFVSFDWLCRVKNVEVKINIIAQSFTIKEKKYLQLSLTKLPSQSQHFNVQSIDLEILGENSCHSMCVINKNYELMYYNGSFKQNYEKINKVQIDIGTNIIEFIHNKLDRNRWKKHFDNILCNVCQFVEDKIDLGDAVRYLQVYPIPLIDKGIINSVFLYYIDVTENKKTELELIKAKERAEESDRLKSSFLANISHEIRTPMNGIIGFANLLKHPDLKGNKKKLYIDIILQSGERMLNLINDLVDISKIESNLVTANLSPTNINTVIDSINEFFKPEALEKGMQLRVHKPLLKNDAIIITDNEKLYAILSNFVKNSLKYSKQGYIDIAYEKKMDTIEFYVRDRGIGIPKAEIKSIFDRFFQSKNVSTNSSQGVGLGLAITKAYVNILGGEIWVESEENKGSTFYFTVPYRQ